MTWFDAGTKKMSVSTFGSFIKLMKLQCTASWVSQWDRAAAIFHGVLMLLVVVANDSKNCDIH